MFRHTCRGVTVFTFNLVVSCMDFVGIMYRLNGHITLIDSYLHQVAVGKISTA